MPYTTLFRANTTSTAVCRNPLPSNSDDFTLPPAWNADTQTPACGVAGTAGADGFADYSALQYAPPGGQFRTQDYERQRTGLAHAGQGESISRRALAARNGIEARGEKVERERIVTG